jgi:membrane fusion protein, macrolide-specific efflux system
MPPLILWAAGAIGALALADCLPPPRARSMPNSTRFAATVRWKTRRATRARSGKRSIPAAQILRTERADAATDESDNLRTKARGYFRRSRRQIALEIALVLGAFAFMGALYFWSGNGPQTAVRTEAVTTGSIERTVTALASIRPKTFVDVGTQVSGQLRKVHVEIGDVVEQDQLLAEIDPTVYQTRVLANRAQIENLKAQLAQTEAQLVLDQARDARSQQLLRTNATSKDAAEAASVAVRITEGKIDSFKAQIAQTQATLQGDEANLGYTKIHAPMAGTIVDQIAYEGQTVNASQSAPMIVGSPTSTP